MAMTGDPSLETLARHMRQLDISPEDGQPVLFLGARVGPDLEMPSQATLHAYQPDRSEADRLVRTGVVLLSDADVAAAQGYPVALVLLPRQQLVAQSWLARGLDALGGGGTLIVAGANAEGIRRYEGRLNALATPMGTVVKNKCRSIAVRRLDPLDPTLLEPWRDADAVRPILDGTLLSRPGLFAWDRIDPGSAMLARHLPADAKGAVADLGCGYGYLSHMVWGRYPKASSLDLYDIDQRAVMLAEANVRSLDRPGEVNAFWQDCRDGLRRRYRMIISNPPFHGLGRSDRPDIGQGFIRVAAEGLIPGGQFWLVANRHLPYERTLDESFRTWSCIADEDGYKVLVGIR